MRRGRLYKKIIIGMIYVFFYITISFSYAQTTVTTSDFSVFINSIQSQLAFKDQVSRDRRLPVVLRQKVFAQFCEVIDTMGTQDLPAYKDNDRYILYHGKQSAFVHILCGPFDLQSQLGSFGIQQDADKQYFLKDDRQVLGIYRRSTDPNQLQDGSCDPVSTMESCDVPQRMTHIMHRLLNDMFDIKQSSTYGGISLDPQMSSKDRADEFIKKRFVGLELCPDNKCEYPKTQNRIQAYFKRAEGLLKGLDILNREYISEKIQADKPNCSMMLTDAYHIFLCGLYTQDQTSLAPFIAAVQNEIFFYRLFMAWYMGWVQSERRIQPDQYQNVQLYEARVTDIINNTQQQIARTQEAVDMSIKMLREMYTTFPIHIGLLIYYEDLYRFRKELAKVVTPLYTLYDKLRNVQDANE